MDLSTGLGLGGELRWPWAIAVVAGLVLVLLLWWSRRPRRPAGAAVLVAGTERLRSLPRYRALVRRHRVRGLLVTLGALVVVAGAVLVLARPQTTETEPRASRSRDLMLCLDGSGSMDDDNLAVVQEMLRVVDGLEGDRVGMMLWSGTAVLIFPLTDDYDYARDQLERAEQAFSGKPDGFFSGLDAVANGSSLIGDGIVSCVNRFDRPTADRTRAVLASSDNHPIGRPVYPLPEAARYASDRDVLLYGIGVPALQKPQRAAALAEFADAAASTGGELVIADDGTSSDQVIDHIDQLEKARAQEPPRRVSRDTPQLGLALSAAGVGLFLGTWLAQLGRRLRPSARRGAR